MYFQITSTVNRFTRDLNALAVSTRIGTRDLLQQAVDEVARPAIAHQFQVAGTPPWEELAEATVERKGHDRPLVDTGRGQDAATDRARWLVTRDRAEYRGDSFPAATWTMALHQHGRDEHDVNFPGRPFVRLQPEDERALDRVGLEWLDGNLRRAGF